MNHDLCRSGKRFAKGSHLELRSRWLEGQKPSRAQAPAPTETARMVARPRACGAATRGRCVWCAVRSPGHGGFERLLSINRVLGTNSLARCRRNLQSAVLENRHFCLYRRLAAYAQLTTLFLRLRLQKLCVGPTLGWLCSAFWVRTQGGALGWLTARHIFALETWVLPGFHTPLKASLRLLGPLQAHSF
jgi:hypothetical protein